MPHPTPLDNQSSISIPLHEKYEFNGMPALDRPDLHPPAGWSLSLLLAANHIHHHALSPDGQQVAFIWERDGLSDIYVMPTAGGWPQRLTHERGPTIYWWDSAPVWSPDGRQLAFTMSGHVWVLPVDGSRPPQQISDFTSGAWSPAWLPDSHGLVVVVARGDRRQLLLTDAAGSWPRPLTHGEGGDDMTPHPDPTGRYIAYVHRPTTDLNRLELRLIELETGRTQPLTGEPGEKDWSPYWSPDGAQIAFLSQRSGYTGVWLIRPDGSNLRQLTHLEHDVSDIAWSPTGQQLAATLNRDGAFDLVLIDAAAGTVRELSTGRGLYEAPQWSPDGDFLTVEYQDATRPPDLYRVSVPAGERQQLTFSNPPALATKELVVPQRIRYRSHDGLEIPALLYQPPRPNSAAILYAHGGPAGQNTFAWDIFAQYLVAKGYTYLAPDFRGSTGYGVAFEHANYGDWGNGDVQDCLAGADYLATLEHVDPARIAIYGPSYGGYLVACCLARDPQYRFACGVSKYGDAHLFTSWALCERETRLYTQMMIGHPAVNRAIYHQGSPIHDLTNVQRPVLLLHGLEDDVVPPQSSEEWATALRRLDKTFEYKTYAGEHHSFIKRHNALDAYRRIERFLDWYLWPLPHD